MNLETVSRRRAFLIHLSISLIIFAVMAVLMVYVWFPGPLFVVDGGWQGMRIIAAVDVVLGPMLTLLIFKPHKKRHRELRFDLSLIAIAQLLALVAGTWTVYQQRTVALVLDRGMLYSVSHTAVVKANQQLITAKLTPQAIEQLSTDKPPSIYARPFQSADMGQYLADVFNGLPETQLRSDRYASFSEHWDAVTAAAVELEVLKVQHAEVYAALEHQGYIDAAYVLLAAKLRFGDAVAVYSRDTQKLLTIIRY